MEGQTNDAPKEERVVRKRFTSTFGISAKEWERDSTQKAIGRKHQRSVQKDGRLGQVFCRRN